VVYKPAHNPEQHLQNDQVAEAAGNSSLRYIDLMLSNNKAEIFKASDSTAALQPLELGSQVFSSVRGTDFLNNGGNLEPHIDRTAFLKKSESKPSLATRWNGLPA
jgi:hypothetical protein